MMNKFQRFLGRILAETCLKMDYFGCKSQKIAKRWRLHPQIPLPPATESYVPQAPFRLDDLRIFKTLLPLKLLVDTDA